MTLQFRNAQKSDLAQIMAIERAGFSSAEAATPQAMAQRIAVIPDSFIVATNTLDRVLGYVVGPVIPDRYLTDDLFDQSQANPELGGYQSVLSLAVAPAHRQAHIATRLLTELAKESQAHQRLGITLTCLRRLVPFYEKNGYRNEGVSQSQHAGEVWYNLVLDQEKH